jgi:UDP-N-acetyl-D-mannosaminuronic acid transferase (WecB/TagA/CpsF family)
MAYNDVIGSGAPGGTSFCSATSEKLSFYGVTPIVQRSGSAQAAVVTTNAVSTTSNIWGFSTSSQANAIIALVNELRAALVAVGLIAGA